MQGTEHMSTTASRTIAKKTPSPYIMYYTEQCQKSKDDQGNKRKWTREARAELGQSWKNLPKEEKEKYISQSVALNLEKSKLVRSDTHAKKRKATFATRCSPYALRDLLDTLGQACHDSIRAVGLGGLLSLKKHNLRWPVCEWLVEIFDCDSRSLTLGGHRVNVSPDTVSRVLGLENNGSRVAFDGDERELCQRYNLPIKGPIKLSSLEDWLKGAEPNSDEFKAKILLYTLGKLLCPGSDVTAPRIYVLCLNEDAIRGRVNWAQHVYDALIDGIQSHQQAGNKTYVSGCLLVLQVILLDHLGRLGRRDISRFSIQPRIGAWGEDEISKTMRKNNDFKKLNDGNNRMCNLVDTL